MIGKGFETSFGGSCVVPMRGNHAKAVKTEYRCRANEMTVRAAVRVVAIDGAVLSRELTWINFCVDALAERVAPRLIEERLGTNTL